MAHGQERNGNGSSPYSRGRSSSRPTTGAAPQPKKTDEEIAKDFLTYVEQNPATLAAKIAVFGQTSELRNWDDIQQHIKTIFIEEQKLSLTQALPTVPASSIKRLQEHLDKSSVQKHPIKYSLMGSALAILLGFAAAFFILISIQAFATVAVMPAIIAALPFLAFLTPLGPIVGILAFSALTAALMLPLYALVVAVVHKATQPKPSELPTHALEAAQKHVVALNATITADRSARVEASNTAIAQGFKELSAQLEVVGESTKAILEQLQGESYPAVPSSHAPEVRSSQDNPLATALRPETPASGHQRILSDNFSRRRAESPTQRFVH